MGDPLILPPDEMAALRTAIEAAYGPDWRDKIAVPRPVGDPLTKDEVRQLLRECVTVVKPGEILLLQPGADYTPNQIREIQKIADWWLEENAPAIKALVVPGEAHQVVRQDAGILP